mgnify:CR=1 FL=1
MHGMLVSGLMVVCGLLFAGALEGNWRWDDSQILLQALRYPIIESFINPEVWQQFSPANLTPWLIFSFKIDLALFDAIPQAFYLHQILAIACASVALYFCLSLWINKVYAFYGSVVFLIGAPSFSVAEQLMTRHYVEGLVFCLAALICYVQHLRRGGMFLLLTGTAFYLLSVTAKEIYVPLVLLLPFLPERDFYTRVRALWPFLTITLLYVVWRGWMLDSLIGGYVARSEYMKLSIIGDILSAFSNFPALLLGSLWLPFTLLFLLLMISYSFLTHSRLILSLIILLLVTLPLVPLVRSSGIFFPDRYLFLFWTMISFAIAYYAERLASSLQKNNQQALIYLTWTGAPLLLLIALLQGLQFKQELESLGSEFDTQARFLLDEDSNSAFIPSENLLPSFWFVTGLQELKPKLMPGSTVPSAVVDSIYLDEIYDKLYRYDSSCSCMEDITSSIVMRIDEFEQKLRPDAPLSLRFEYQQGYFSWIFGPYEYGSYQVVSDVLGVITAPATGEQRVTLANNAPFYLRYTAPEGWISYSSLQKIQHNAPAINWKRD